MEEEREIKVGDRLLIKSDRLLTTSIVILEISPSKEYVKTSNELDRVTRWYHYNELVHSFVEWLNDDET